MADARKSTVGLAMIVRDAGDKLASCLDSVKDHVDQIVIVLAGESKDNTADIASKYTKDIYAFEWVDNFAAARNFSFSKLTTDWLMWLDADDIVVGAENIAHLIEEGEARGFGCYHLPYEYRHDAFGNVTVVHTRERLLKRDLGWEWLGRVHEYARSNTQHLVGFADDVVIKHTTDKANTERNLRLLALMEAEMTPEHPEYPRLMACLQDIHQSTGDHLKAIEYGTRAFETMRGPAERWTAACELARSHQALKQWGEVFSWSLAAVAIHPEYSLPFLLMAHASWHGEQNSVKALRFLDDADRREEAPLTIFRQPQDYTLRRWDIEHRCYADLGQWDLAWETVRKAEDVIGLPGDGNRAIFDQWDYFGWYYLERRHCEKSIAGAEAIVDHLFRRGDTLRALRFMENDLPLSIRQDPRIERLYARVKALTAHVRGESKDYVAFYESEHTSKDDPMHVLNGINYEPYRMNIIVERLKKRGAKRVLDVGCGAGEPAIFLAKNGFEVVGLDINRAAITEARRRAKRVSKGNGVKPYQLEFRNGSIDTLGPENLGKFDAVLMMELIEHLPPADVPLYLATAEDFLNPGGAVLMTTPGMLVGDIPGVWGEFPRDHVQEFSRVDLEKLIMGSASRRTKLPISLHKVYDPKTSIPGFASWFIEYEWHNEVPNPEAWARPIVFYIGRGLEEWDPRTPDETGIGGSETWAAKVARELRAKGHPVVVYAACDGVFDGVIYRDASKFDPKAPFAGERAWMCVVSRYLEVLDERPNAKNVVFVAHDTDYGAELTPTRLANLDTYAVMSEWQRQHTATLYAPTLAGISSKLRVIQNGIEPAFFEGTEERKAHSFLWSSSPDRGLDVLLSWWPQIREMWADATLDVFYGWDNIDRMMGQRPWLEGFKAKVLQLARQDGVTWKGRIGQRALAKEMQRHQFWLYPAIDAFGEPWHETFCITAVEAAAGGCIGIFPARGALAERPGLMSPNGLTIKVALGALKSQDNGNTNQIDPNDYSWTRAAESLLDALPAALPEKEVVMA